MLVILAELQCDLLQSGHGGLAQLCAFTSDKLRLAGGFGAGGQMVHKLPELKNPTECKLVGFSVWIERIRGDGHSRPQVE